MFDNSLRIACRSRRGRLVQLHQAVAKIIRCVVQIHLGRAILLAQLVTVRVIQKRYVPVDWRAESQNTVQPALTMRGVEEVFPAHDVGEVRLRIINRRCQLVCEQTISPLDDEILRECFDSDVLRPEEGVFKVSH